MNKIIMSDVKEQVDQTIDDIKFSVDKIQSEGKVCCQEYMEKCKEYKEKAHKYIKENPEKSFFIGMGIGALLALILFGRRN